MIRMKYDVEINIVSDYCFKSNFKCQCVPMYFTHIFCIEQLFHDVSKEIFHNT